MLRNYLITALHNLERNPLYAAINILGLAVAFAAAILVAQFVLNEFSYDTWIPGYRDIYKITDVTEQAGQPPLPSDLTPSPLAARLRLALPGAVVARLKEASPAVRHQAGDAPLTERAFAWADPNFFKVFPLPVLAGNLGTALRHPDTVVITRSIARKYFHRDAPIGDTLEIDLAGDPHLLPWRQHPGWHALRVTAVLKDLPSNTNLASEVFASGRSAYSGLADSDAVAEPAVLTNFTFVRLAHKQSLADLGRGLNAAVQPVQAFYARLGGGSRFSVQALPLSDAHLTPPGLTDTVTKPMGSRSVSSAISAVAALIVLVAAINFVTLMTARATRRSVEVGVRKALGARRLDLMVQFIGEALIQVAIADLIAMSLAELLIRPFSAFVQRGLTLDFAQTPLLVLGILIMALTIGLLASIYPALVLSSFRPAAALKGAAAQTTGSALARHVLVVIQFAILVTLVVITATIYRQTRFALTQNAGGDSKLVVGVRTDCSNAFPEEVRRLPGVAAAACSSIHALSVPGAKIVSVVQYGDHRRGGLDIAPVDFGFFRLYGIQPLAGRLFSRNYGEDGALNDLGASEPATVVINETASHDMGFADPRAAIGGRITWIPGRWPWPKATAPSRIVGVIRDMPATVRAATDPTVYFVLPKTQGLLSLGVLSIRLTGRDVPGTLGAIERLWKATGATQPIQEVFWKQFRLNEYLDVVIQGVTIAICAGLAVLIACLGLFALSAYTTERRTKEIGIRKVMGASTADVVKLLVWQFTVPVLWAIVIALPLGFLAMDHWLHGFVYHVNPSPWTFVLAAIAAVAIAWATVIYQSYLVARARPAGALRYE